MSILQETVCKITLILVLISTTPAAVIAKCSTNLNHCSCDGILTCAPNHFLAETLSLSHSEHLIIRPGTFQNMSLKSITLHKVMVRYINCEAFVGLEDTLETVTLSEVNLSGDAEFPLCTLISLKNLKNINIRKTRIGYSGKEPLATRKLESLSLRDVELEGITHGWFRSSDTLSTLCLSGNGLRKSAYQEIGQFPTLETLDLSNNKFTELPSSELWQNLRALKSVSFRNNEIAQINTDTFLRNLNSIETISFEIVDLRGNGMTFIHPGAFANVFIRRFHLSDNPLQAFGKDANDIRGLDVKYLYLANASLSSLASGVFDHLNSLTFLDMSNNRLLNTQWMTDITCQSLTYLNLRGNHISSFVPKCSVEAVIERVDLRDNELRVVDNQALRVGTLLLSHNDITSANLTVGFDKHGTINLGYNSLKFLSPITMVIPKETSDFHGFIDVSTNSMEQLPVVRFQFGEHTEGDDQRRMKIPRIYLTVVLTGNIIHTLTPFQIELSEKSNEMTSPSVKVKIMHQRNNVSTIPSCEFFENRVYVVSDLDLSYNRMKVVNLKNCQLGGLKTLNLNYNEITSIVLGEVRDLRILSLRGNRISLVDGSLFGGLPALYSLDLRDNQLKSFSDVFRSLTSLVWLKLHGNPLKCDCDMSWMINSEYRLDKLACDATGGFRGYDVGSFLGRNCSSRLTLSGELRRPYRVHHNGNRISLYPNNILPDHTHEATTTLKIADPSNTGVSDSAHDGRYIFSTKDIIMFALASLVPIMFVVLIAITVLYCRIKGRENRKLEQERAVQMNKLFAMRRPSGFDGVELRRPSDAGGFGLRRPSVGFELPSTIMEKRSPSEPEPPFVEVSLEPDEGTYKLYPAITKRPDKSDS